MLFSYLNNPLALVISLASLIIAITIHEFSHAYVADNLGDPTPRLQGRLTLNPLAHLDPIGTLLIIVARFGWGKPVQFDPFNLQHPRRDAALISIAGPISNIILAIAASLLIRAFEAFVAAPNTALLIFVSFLHQLIVINVVLAIFNLVPIHPLDGFKIVLGMLPPERAREWAELERYGMLFLLFLILPLFGSSSPLFTLIGPVIEFILNILLPGTAFI